MKGKGLIAISAAVIALFVMAIACSSSVTNLLGNGVSRSLDSMALVKSMELANNQVGVIDKLVSILTWQNVLFGVGALAVLFIASMIVRGNTNNKNGQTIIQLPHMDGFGQEQGALPGGTRYVVFGPRGDNYLLSLPRNQREEALEDLREKCALLESSLEGPRPILPWGNNNKPARFR